VKVKIVVPLTFAIHISIDSPHQVCLSVCHDLGAVASIAMEVVLEDAHVNLASMSTTIIVVILLLPHTSVIFVVVIIVITPMSVFPISLACLIVRLASVCVLPDRYPSPSLKISHATSR